MHCRVYKQLYDIWTAKKDDALSATLKLENELLSDFGSGQTKQTCISDIKKKK